MSFSGGTFTNLYNWVNEANAGNPIDATKMNNQDQDYATGLTLCVTRDGQGQMAADFNPATTNTYNLGSTSFAWQVVNANQINAIGSGISNGAIRANGYIQDRINLVKGSDTNRISTTTNTNDPDLAYAIPVAGTYAFELFLHITTNGSTTNGWQGAMNYSGTFSNAGSFGDLTCNGGGTASTIPMSMQSSPAGTTLLTLTNLNTVGIAIAKIKGVITCSTTGTLALSWSQNSSVATNSTVKAGSYMMVMRII